MGWFLLDVRCIHINIQEKVEGRGIEERGGTCNRGKWVDWEGGKKKGERIKGMGERSVCKRERRDEREGGNKKGRGV